MYHGDEITESATKDGWESKRNAKKASKKKTENEKRKSRNEKEGENGERQSGKEKRRKKREKVKRQACPGSCLSLRLEAYYLFIAYANFLDLNGGDAS